MNILITAGPTHEPIDPVRYLGNRSSGQMGAALARRAIERLHQVTLIVGPQVVPMPQEARRIDIETAEQMSAALAHEWSRHDLLIMAAAVADFRPIRVSSTKIDRAAGLTIECEPTTDLVSEAARRRRDDQRIIGFSLEADGDEARARDKLLEKGLDLMVYNPIATMGSATIESVLLYPDGRAEHLPCRSKAEFADNLLDRAQALFLRP